MALENFKPSLWEGSIMENFHESSFVGMITTPPVDKKGGKVIFNRIQKGVWKNYTSGSPITWDQVATTKLEMDFPNQKYFAFMVDDCDAVQTKSDVLKAVTKEQSAVLGEELDQEIIKYMCENVAAENKIGEVGTPTLVKAVNAYDLLVDLNTLANKRKIPVTERCYIISPDYLGLLAKDSRFTKEYTILQNGLLDGATVSGNTLICKADNPIGSVLLIHKSGTGFAMQLEGTPEAVRLQDYIADGVRGLVKYGYVKLRDESSCLAYIKYE